MPPSRPSLRSVLGLARGNARRHAAAVAAASALLLASTVGAPLASADSFDPAKARLVDLTHPFNNETVYWPTASSGFGYAMLSKGQAPGGWYYSAGAFQAPEHGGTHLDAPVHFKEGGATADQLPLSRLFAPVVVIDVSTQAAADRDYELQQSDIMTFESGRGPIAKGTIVLMRTGWSSKWPDRLAYLGDDTPAETSNLHFPGFGQEAMRTLVEQRGVAAVGIDTASLDPGRSTDFMAHRISAAGGVPGFENLTNLDQLPARGAWLIALPMKIENGTGGPLRAVAVIPQGR